MLPDEKGQTAADFLRRAIRWIAAQGVATERVMTDNGSCYRFKVFTAVLEEHGARHLSTRPYTPRTNGKAGRFIRTAKEGWAYARSYGHSNDWTAQHRAFLNYYNCGRPHGGIDGTTPLQRLVELRVNNVLEKYT